MRSGWLTSSIGPIKPAPWLTCPEQPTKFIGCERVRNSIPTILPFRLSAPRATEIIRNAAKDSARVFFKVHAEQRMKKRRTTRIQVMRCLKHGAITEGPAPDVHGNWACRIEWISAGRASVWRSPSIRTIRTATS
jgi:Domain of unknown function (DUF4258)